jgi:hypothetical protein
MGWNLTFIRDGKIEGEGDIAPFAIDGRFDGATSTANWTKAYVGMHSVEYFGVIVGGQSAGTGLSVDPLVAFGFGLALLGNSILQRSKRISINDWTWSAASFGSLDEKLCVNEGSCSIPAHHRFRHILMAGASSIPTRPRRAAFSLP